jgi:hypothetical protein
MLEFGLPGAGWLRQIERPDLLAQDFRVEERLGFNSHLSDSRLCGAGRKPRAFAQGEATCRSGTQRRFPTRRGSGCSARQVGNQRFGGHAPTDIHS